MTQSAYPPPPSQPYAPQPAPMPAPSPGQPMTFRFHAGARGALNIAAVLLLLLVVTIPISIRIFVPVAGGRVDITGSELYARALFTKRWSLDKIRRIGVLAVPIYARGIGGVLARRKVGGPNAIHLCFMDDRGKKSSFIVSMYER